MKKQRVLRLFPKPKYDIPNGIVLISSELEVESHSIQADILKGKRDYDLPPNIKNFNILKYGLNV